MGLSYSQYLQSKHWIVFCSFNKTRSCWSCGCLSDLHLHHVTYDRLGEELAEDVVTLCVDHHRAVHYIPRMLGLSLDPRRWSMPIDEALELAKAAPAIHSRQALEASQRQKAQRLREEEHQASLFRAMT